MKKIIYPATVLVFLSLHLHAQHAIITENKTGTFPLVNASGAAPLYVDGGDDWLVQKAASFLQGDIEKVSGKQPEIIHAVNASQKNIVIIGSVKGPPLINQLVKNGKLNIDSLTGKWETYKIQVINNPFKGIDNALVIVGSDKRGTAYAVFELSQQMGVSPWYWWADVPVVHKAALYVEKGAYTYGPPSVQYRGIFINDEAPAFSGWTREKFGGVNHLVYEKMFELLLRLKANYLWPAMWGNAFNDDDTLNPVLADKYGIVMGTSHHEPMLRAQQEWKRYGKGDWNYQTNDSVLRAFWTKGIQHMGTHESVVTIGMRGDGDMPMTEGSNIALLEKIVADQRKIIEQVTGKPAATVPQSWALYKEVQDYYDKGMRVPDDVTLLLCDDNWGDIRKLPKLTDKPRTGGYGIYYHFDYVGDPRNYKWLNTNNIARTWEQMHLAKEYGADKIWVVNVGDLKPMEYPISFFLDYAWDTKAWTADNINTYAEHWAAQQFGNKYTTEIGDMLTNYSDYNSRRKPELISPDTYSLTNYREAETITADYNALAKKAKKIYGLIPAEYKDAYYQLVLFPIEACANLNELHVTTGRNRLYAAQGRALTRQLADSVKTLFDRDAALSHYYNTVLGGGKWDHMADQTHISYTYWQQPEKDVLPDVKTIALPAAPAMGVAIEGTEEWWPNSTAKPVLPEFNRYLSEKHYIEIFNRGRQLFDYTIEPGAEWLKLSSKKGTVNQQERIWVDVDWQKAPVGKTTTPVTIKANGNRVVVYAVVNNAQISPAKKAKNFIEYNGYISIKSDDFTKAVNAASITWQTIPQIGKTGNGVTAFPVTAESSLPSANNAHLEYNIFVFDTGRITTNTYFSPTIDFNNKGLRYAISIDDEIPQVFNITADASAKAWQNSVADNIRIIKSTHTIAKAGWHVLKFWYVDPAVVLQKIVLDFGGVKQSYLGPPETLMK
jgi:hypothetical protein